MNDRILRALRCEPVDRTPVWFMRQAGRSLPRYRERRDQRGMFEILRDPEAAAEITVLPLDYYPVDAAILFNDLVTPFFGAGLGVTLEKGVGPVVDRPIRGAGDVDALSPFEPEEALSWCMEQIGIVVDRIDVPLLAFVGAPFTLCSYLVESPRTRDLRTLKRFLWEEPRAWDRLAEFWVDHLARFGIAQHRAGAAAIQVFDSWAGVLSPADYRRYVFPHNRRLLERLSAAGVPTINFFTGNPALLPQVAETGGDCVSVDWRVGLAEARRVVGPGRSIQGNLDPACLLAGRDVAVARAAEILAENDGRPGHIFNLGHGILPETDHRVIRSVVEAVQAYPLGTGSGDRARPGERERPPPSPEGGAAASRPMEGGPR